MTADPAPEAMTREIAAFSEALRNAGLPTHVRAVVDAARAAGLVDLSDRVQFHTALRANFVTDVSRYPLFDRVFEEFWTRAKFFEKECCAPEDEMRLRTSSPADKPVEGQVADPNPPSASGASAEEVLIKKDLRYLTPEEEPQLHEIMQRLLRKLKTRPSRRFRPGGSGRAVDFRRTFRRGVQSGGELLKLLRREKRPGKRKLAFLGDVSGSMDQYSRFFFQLAFGLSAHEPLTEVYAFSTRLFPLTRHIQGKHSTTDYFGALKDTKGWSGGTRIGECLKEFNTALARKPHLANTTVIILSDGWNRGDARIMLREMVRLKSAVAKIYWLNPLKAEPGYRPLSRGMATALPYLDGFYAANNLESLARFAARLGG